jgi:hypothetical protein
MLLPRLEQGIAREASSQAVVKVLTHNAELLVRARTVLQSVRGGKSFVADRSAWSLTAMVLETGARPSSVRSLVNASGGITRTYRSAVLLYAALVTWGLVSRESLSICIAVIHSRLPASQYGGISDIFVQGRSLRIPPEHLAARLLDALPRTATYEDLKREVLY